MPAPDASQMLVERNTMSLLTSPFGVPLTSGVFFLPGTVWIDFFPVFPAIFKFIGGVLCVAFSLLE